MPPALAARKRKATEKSQNNDSDSDTIVVAPTRNGDTSAAKPARSPLKEVTSNKRQRVLDRVVIPVHDGVMSDAAVTPHSQSPASIEIETEAGAERVASTKPASKSARAKKEDKSGLIQGSLSVMWASSAPKSSPATSSAVARTPVSQPKPQVSSRSFGTKAALVERTELKKPAAKKAADERPRRSTAPVTFVSSPALEASSGEDDEDEPVRSATRARSGAKAQRRNNNDDDDDFGEKEQSSSAEEEEELEEEQSDVEMSDAVSDASASDEGLKVAKGKKGKAPKAQKPSKKPDAKEKLLESNTNDEMKKMNRKGSDKGLNANLPPLSETADIFADITRRALELGLGAATKNLAGKPLRVATMCSGTESPILAMQMVHNVLKEMGLETIEVEHVFSAEIVPYKQAYIERNFAPPIIFRDITEFIAAFETESPMATTAYGARVPIPPADIVFAGTSCVDYSKQNTKKKGMDDEGESGETWYGALAYCKAVRPKIVIFENVQSAPWDKQLMQYRELGYDCEGVCVDSKDYYIPHTRQRGYMVCFDVSGLKDRSVGLGKRWQDLMEQFKRPASSAVSAFLMPSDQVVLRNMGEEASLREVNWAKCELRHMRFRQEERLGNGRPITQWQESGHMSVPETGVRSWYLKQVERVKDTIEALVLMYGRKFAYDPRYKTIIWDVSQNIDRINPGSPGVIGCILPSGIYLVSDANRILTAEETLRLQGLPLEFISFTTETQAELLNFAGNAMTSTVVGSAILAALILGHDILASVDRSSTILEAPLVDEEQRIAAIEKPSATTSESFTYRSEAIDVDLNDVLKSAESAARKCHCEGASGLCEKPIQKCADCEHTACITCGGNPPHNYHQTLSGTRREPTSFAVQLKSRLPLQLRFTGALSVPNTAVGIDPSNLKRYTKVVHDLHDSVYSLHSVRRTQCWIASYLAPNARLDLIIEGGHAEWRLFATPEKELASNDWLRRTLQQFPVAKATVTDSLLPTEWQVRLPVERALGLEVCGTAIDIPTWWARLGLPDHLQDTQKQYLDIKITAKDATDLERSLSGRYRYLPKCGQASDSLYRKVEEGRSSNEKPTFLFLDPTRTGDPNEDVFVFSHDTAHLSYDEVRAIDAYIKAPWRPWPTKGKPIKPKVMVHADWIHSKNLGLVSEVMDLVMQRSVLDSSASSVVHCGQAQHVLGCNVPQQAADLPDQFSQVTKDQKFISKHTWVFEAMRRQLDLGDWRVVDNQAILQDCVSCAPAKPLLRWRIDVDKLQGYEDPVTAANYERAIKARMDSLVVTAASSSGGYILDLGVNIVSLVHRAAARLPSGSIDVDAQWRLDTGNVVSSVMSRPKFKLMATDGVDPFEDELDMSVSLFPNQRLVLAWMQKQELGVTFRAEEAEEAVIQGLGWRAEVRVSAPVLVRGGICADHPGFGKTITSLALAHAEFTSSSEGKIRAGLEGRRDTLSPGLLTSSATLIVCPHTLVAQWANEILDKLRYTSGVLQISRLADLNKYTIADFENARFIVVNRNIFSNDSYIDRIAAFAATSGPASNTGGRAFAQWLRHAIDQIPEHLRILRGSNGVSNLKQHINKKYKQHVEDSYTAAVPSRRLRGRDYVPAKDKKDAGANALKAAAKAIDTNDVHRPLFEMFYFNRLVVDEFHQAESKETTALAALKADKRWGLSGTPALDDLFDVSQIAALIGMPLRIGSDAKGVMQTRNINRMRADLTAFERFDAMRVLPSRSVHDRLCETHQLFLDTFVRQNVMDFAQLQCRELLHPTVLDLDHCALYTELSQHLNSSEMRIKRGKKGGKDGKATDREERLYQAVKSADSGEEALSRFAAFLDRNVDEFAKAQSGLDAAITIREEETKDILKVLRKMVVAAQQKEPAGFQTWKQSLVNKDLRDEETLASINELLTSLHIGHDARSTKIDQTAESDEGEEEGGDGLKNIAGSHPLTSMVIALSKQLVVSIRSLRYLRGVQKIQRHATNKQARLQHCEATGCQTLLDSDTDIAVSALCGHSICASCYKDLRELHKEECPAPNCSCSMLSYNLLWLSKMGDLHQARPSPSGTKLAQVVEILDIIRNKKEQAVLFVQYAEQLREVERALQEAGISSVMPCRPNDTSAEGKKAARSKSKPADAAVQIERFQKDRAITVMILNASDETAAGLNLQNANHVIFVSPLMRDSQYAYEATMAQAIGRVRRHGQQRPIHVHRIVALHTIDVDILESRERRTDAVVEVDGPTVAAPSTALVAPELNGKPKGERCQLVKVDEKFSLQPQSWLCDPEGTNGEARVKGRSRVSGWEDWSSQVKFRGAFQEDDE
ncbi:hypothetical protein LTR17_002397 [Elasticomyces elasticus]|nr:hypothetical protein LTR17_002397 [Elasticomyces elasticus]